MFFNSTKDINRLRKEINRLVSKGMSNIYLKVTIEKVTYSKLRFSKFEKFISWSLFGISLNFKTYCCNLKIIGLEAKLSVAFLLFLKSRF